MHWVTQKESHGFTRDFNRNYRIMVDKLISVVFFYRFINNLEATVHSQTCKPINGVNYLLQWNSKIKEMNFRNLFRYERAYKWQMSFYITKNREKFHKKDNPDFTCKMSNSEIAIIQIKDFTTIIKPFLKTLVSWAISEKDIQQLVVLKRKWNNKKIVWMLQS